MKTKIVLTLLFLLPPAVGADEIFPLQEHCRVLDSRNIPGAPLYLQPGITYSFHATLASSGPQGGDGYACGIPLEASAIGVNITETSANGWGYMKAFPWQGVEPETSSVTNSARLIDLTTGSSVALGRFAWIPLNQGRFSLKRYGSGAYVIIDVQAYTLPPQAPTIPQ